MMQQFFLPLPSLRPHIASRHLLASSVKQPLRALNHLLHGKRKISIPSTLTDDPVTAYTSKPQSKKTIAEAFPNGLAYEDPCTFVKDRTWKYGINPHHDLNGEVRDSLWGPYESCRNGHIDRTTIPAYFFCGDRGSGKSANATDFSNTLVACAPYGSQLKGRLERAKVFHVGLTEEESLIEFEFKRPLQAIGIRMLHRLLDLWPLDETRETYVAPTPLEVFRLVAKFEGKDLSKDFTGVLVVDDLDSFIKSEKRWMDRGRYFRRALTGIGETARDPAGSLIIHYVLYFFGKRSGGEIL